jgi:hypothetical protein
LLRDRLRRRADIDRRGPVDAVVGTGPRALGIFNAIEVIGYFAYLPVVIKPYVLISGHPPTETASKGKDSNAAPCAGSWTPAER